MKRTLLFLMLVLQLFCKGILMAQDLQTNVISGELPDPSILEVDGVYYATGSSNNWGPIYPIYQSTDLKNWTFLTYAFNQKPKWTTSDYWAPELFYHKDTFYCYYTARKHDGSSHIGVATTKDISKGFKDHGLLLEWGKEAIDPFIYKEGEKLFITWKAYGLNPDKPIQILASQLTADGLALKGEHFTVLTADQDSWEAGGIEGQCIVEKDGYLYMLYSGNACCGGGCDYQIGIARAKKMTGPWEKYSMNPLLKGNENWKCPGHGTMINTKNKWYYLYHAYNSKGFPYIGRTVLLSELTWNQESGWPQFVGRESSENKVLKSTFIEEFDDKKLSEQWRYDLASYSFKVSIKKGKLKLEDEKENSSKIGVMIGVNPEGADFTFQTQLVNENNALKGLVLYATNDKNIGFGAKGKQLILWQVNDHGFEELSAITIEKTENIHLKADVSEAHLVEFFYSNDGQNWKPMFNSKDNTNQVKGNQLSWWSWGIKAGIFVKKQEIQNSGYFENFTIDYN